MNIDRLRVMLELKAVQNFGSSEPDHSSVFQDILAELYSDTTSFTTNSKINNSPVTSIAKTSLPPLSLLKSNGLDENLEKIITKTAETYNIPSNLIKAVIKQESNFNSKAVSAAGALGLMQLMPDTARSLGVEKPFDPEQNIVGGSKYLKQLLNKYDNNFELALAAYNSGPGNVDKYGGIPPFIETQKYVRNVLQTFLG